MSGSSVRDRIKAAEQASGSDKAQNASTFARRGTKLSLNTDEHIKEEFLRRGDGGWHKRVDIGQHQKFVAPPLIAPVIKLTADTPIVTTPSQQLPGKVDLPKAFGATGESSKMNRRMSMKGAKSSPLASVEEDWQRVARLEAEQQEAIDLAEGKTRHEEWDRVAAMEAKQQAEMDAAAILAEAEKDQAERKAKSPKSSSKKVNQWDKVAAREAKQQADMDADAILAELAKDEKTRRKADLEAEALLAEFEQEEAARKKVPGAFDDSFESGNRKASTSKVPKRKESLKTGSKKNIPTSRYDDLLDEEVIVDESPSHSRSPVRERGKSKFSLIDEDEEELHYQKPKPGPREKILFDPIEYQRKKQARQERRASRQQVNDEHETIVEEVGDKPRSRARAVRSPSILLVHVNDNDDRESHHSSHRHKHRSRSRSNHGHSERKQRHSPDDHRKSSPSLRPSFSSSTRHSISDMLDPFMRSPRSSHHRTYSDDHSMASVRSEISIKKLEAVEYIAGKRLDHLPLSPPKSPSRPVGFVRSRSHTGQYSEGFTHERKLLRKPSDEDEVIDHVRHDWEDPKQRRQSRHSHSRPKDEPWELKILHEIVRR